MKLHPWRLLTVSLWVSLAAAQHAAFAEPQETGAGTEETVTENRESVDWREELGSFRIGMLADPGAGRMVTGLADIKKAYENALGMPVEILVARNYAALIDAHATGRIEYSILSSLAYATAWTLCECVEPLVAPRHGEEIGIRSILILRNYRLRNDKEVRLVKSAADSLTGAILPQLAMTAEADLSIPGSSVVEASSESEALQMFLDGDADGLFGWVRATQDGAEEPSGGTWAMLADAGVRPSELQVVWLSEPLRYGPHVIRKDLDPAAKQLLRDFLLRLATRKPDIFHLLDGPDQGNFVEVSRDDYASALNVLEQLTETEKARQ